MDNEETTTVEVVDDDRRRTIDQVKSVLQAAKDKAIGRALSDLGEIIHEASETVDEPVSERSVERQPLEVHEDERPSGRGGRMPRVIGEATDPLYRALPAAEREIRNPQTDELCARWIRAAIYRDFTTVREVMLMEREWFVQYRQRSDGSLVRAPLDLDLSTGDSLIPLPLANVITLKRQDGSVLRPLVRRWTSPNTSLRVPISSIAVAEMEGEKVPGGNAGASGPTPTEIQLDKKKMRWSSSATEEFLADTPFNVVSWFTEAVGEAFGNLEDVQICTSAGTGNNFSGNITDGVPTVTQAGVNFDYVDIVAVHHAVPKPYRARGVWLVDNATLVTLDSLTGSDGHPILRAGSNMPSVRGDAGGSAPPDGYIFNKPVYEVPLAANTLMFGDTRGYHMLDGGGMSMRADASVKFETDEIAFKSIQRVDGRIGVPEGLRLMAVTP